MFSSTRRMWFLIPCFKFFPKVRIFFSQSTKTTKKVIIFLKVFREKNPWTLRLMFWEPCPKCFAKVRKFSAQGAKITKIQGFSQKKPQSLHLDSPNAVLIPLGEGFFPKTKNSLVKVLRRLKNHKFSQKKFSIFFPGLVNCGFENHIVKCLLNAIKMFPQMTTMVFSRHKKYKKIINFKFVFPQNCPLHTKNEVLKNTPQVFLPKFQETFCSKDDRVSLKAREALRNHSSFTSFFLL